MANVVIEVHKDAVPKRDCTATYSSKSSDCERWATSYNVEAGLAADLLRCADLVCAKMKKGCADETELISCLDSPPQAEEPKAVGQKKSAPWWCCFAEDEDSSPSLLSYDAESRLLLKVLRARFATKLQTYKMGLTVRTFDFGEFRVSPSRGHRSPNSSPRSGSPSSGPSKAELEFRNPPTLVLLKLGGKWSSGDSIPVFTRSYVQYLVNTRVEYYEPGSWAERQAQRLAYEGKGPTLPHVEPAIPMATVRARLLMEENDSPSNAGANTPGGHPTSLGSGRSTSQGGGAFWPPSPLFLPPGLPGEARAPVPSDMSEIAGLSSSPVVHRRRSSSGDGLATARSPDAPDADAGSTGAGLGPGGLLQRRGSDGDSSIDSDRGMMREPSTDTDDAPDLRLAKGRDSGAGEAVGPAQRVALGQPGASSNVQAEESAGKAKGMGGSLTLRSFSGGPGSASKTGGRSLRHPSSPLARLVSSPSTGPNSGKVSSLLNPLRAGMMGAAIATAQAEQAEAAEKARDSTGNSSSSTSTSASESTGSLASTSASVEASREDGIPPPLPAETGSPPLLALS